MNIKDIAENKAQLHFLHTILSILDQDKYTGVSRIWWNRDDWSNTEPWGFTTDTFKSQIRYNCNMSYDPMNLVGRQYELDYFKILNQILNKQPIWIRTKKGSIIPHVISHNFKVK